MDKNEREEILKIIDQLQKTLNDMPDCQDEIVSLNEKVDINNHLILRILDKLDLKEEIEKYVSPT